MGGERLLPIDLDPGQPGDDVPPGPPGAGFQVAGPIRADTTPIVKDVVKDWDPPNPTGAGIVVKGKTLADLEPQLNRQNEWGKGGGSLRAERLANVTTPDVTVHLHANLVFALPEWEGYDQASTKAKAEWDRMVGKLRIHEQRHVDIAIEECDRAAAALIGEPMSKIGNMVTQANTAMATRQKALDTSTEHGSKPGVQYGDVFLDTSIP